jgi:hypothetical protein
MGKQRIKPNHRRRLLRLPDLDHRKRAVLNSLGSPASRRVYEYAIDQFIAWYTKNNGKESVMIAATAARVRIFVLLRRGGGSFIMH